MPKSSGIGGTLLRILALSVLFSSCQSVDEKSEEGRSPGDSKPVVIDLLGEFEHAELKLPTKSVLPGYPSSRPHLISGWHRSSFAVGKEDRAGWTVGPKAEMELFVARPEALSILLHCAPVLRPGDTPPTLRVEINGHPVFEQVLDGRWQEYRFTVSGELLAAGENLMTFHHPPEHSGRQLKKDTRVAWRRIEVESPEPADNKAKIVADGDALFLPTGQRLDYFLELAPKSRWRSARVVPRGGAEALDVTWAPWDESPRDDSAEKPTGGKGDRSRSFARAEGSSWVLNPKARARQRGRLSFQARGDSGGAFISLPRIETKTAAEARDTVALQEPTEASQELAKQETEPPRNLIVYLIDTLRSDHLGCYGYDRPTSPNIDFWADQSVLFENARAQAPWTRAAVGSVFTGLWPRVHRAEDDPDALPQEVETLAERLAAAGYSTAAVVSNGNISEPFGFSQGFESFLYLDPDENEGKVYRAHEVNQEAFRWLDERPETATEPVLLYLHTMNPHAPYEAPEPFHSSMCDESLDPKVGTIEHLAGLSLGEAMPSPGVREHLVDLYDAEILSNDHAFGELMKGLESRGFLDNSWVVLISDHGEEFYDHGDWQHGHSLHIEQLAVPLIIRPPGGTETIRRTERVGQVDLLPTFLDVLGLEPPAHSQGRSLRSLLGTEGGSPAGSWNHETVAHLRLRGIEASSLIDRSGRWKTIVDHDHGEDGFPRLFDLRTGDEILAGSTGMHGYGGRLLRSRLQYLDRMTPRPFEPEAASNVSEELQNQLEALGYAR